MFCKYVTRNIMKNDTDTGNLVDKYTEASQNYIHSELCH